MSRTRLDLALVERGLMPTRARARDAIQRGTVGVDGRIERKPAASVGPEAVLTVDDPAAAWVSRAALKLIGALDHFGLDPAGRHCLDVGASTGGFTQVLLARGAAAVTAIDVGHGQLAAEVAADRRVTSIEGLNARDLAAEHLAQAPDFVVADVSFISLALALPPALALAAAGAVGVFLVKPQFEVGREAIGRGGLVRDPAAADAAVERIADLVAASGWRVLGRAEAAIAGGDGNREFVLAAEKRKSRSPPRFSPLAPRRVSGHKGAP